MSHRHALVPFDPAHAARGLAALGVRDSALFESSLPGGERGRWSLLGFQAVRRYAWFEAEGWTVTGPAPATPALEAFERALLADAARPWEGLVAAERTLAPVEAANDPAAAPFRGGFAVALSYDAARALEGFGPWPVHAQADVRWPAIDLRLFGAIASIDHRTGAAALTAPAHPLFADPPAARGERAAARLAEAIAAVPPALPEPAREIVRGAPVARDLAVNLDDAGYATAFARLHEYLKAGDLYQANLTRRFHAPYALDAPALYARLRRTAPAPYAVLLDDAERAVVSASPELFLARRGRRLVTRPIKGTRPRDLDPARDAALAAELLASPKDAAEHVMIVDVHRNDLGKVAEWGSVHVEALAAHEAFPTVHHLTSTIAATLREDRGAWDAIAAAFPAGSITGAPKRRACEVLEELEPTRRAVYTGALGWWDLSGDFALNVAIRTILLTAGRASFQAGGGIVIDSDVADEAQETWNKARSLHAAIEGEALA